MSTPSTPGAIWDRLLRALRSAEGSVAPDERARVMDQVLEGACRDLHPSVEEFVHKVATASYQVTEADREALRKAGLGDDAILELTLAAAAASAHRGVRALRHHLPLEADDGAA